MSNWVYDEIGPEQASREWLPGGHWWDDNNSFRWFMGYSNEGHRGTEHQQCYNSGRGLGPQTGESGPFHRGWCDDGIWGLVFVR